MAKKIRFPLEMEDNIEVRTLSELKKYFSLTRVIEYVSNGKLITWLRDRYEGEIADAIEKLDINNTHFPEQICEIFNINNVAFCQDDLYDLLDEQYHTIYLYGNKFEIPLNKNNVTYIGFNNPVVIINADKKINWEEKKIKLSNVQFDDNYKKLLEKKNTHIYFPTSNLTKETTKKLIRTNLLSTPNLLDPCLKTKQGKLIASNLILDHLDDDVPKELLEPLVDLIKGAKTEEELIEKMTVYIAGAAPDDPMQQALSELLVLFNVDNTRTINGISMADINKDIDNDIFAGFIMLVMFHALLQDDSMAELLSFVGVDGSVKIRPKQVNIKSGKMKISDIDKQSNQSTNPKAPLTEEKKKVSKDVISNYRTSNPLITSANSETRSLEDVYKGFHLERGGSNFSYYVGKIGSITWKFLISDDTKDQYMKDAKIYINTIYSNLDAISNQFNTNSQLFCEADISVSKIIKKVRRRNSTDELIAVSNMSGAGKDQYLEVNNGLYICLYTNGTFEICDNRNYYFTPNKYVETQCIIDI